MITHLSVFAPIIVSALCIPVLFHHAGYSKLGVGLSLLPIVIVTSALLSVVFGERMILDGPVGTWAIAASLIVLIVNKREPATQTDRAIE